MVWQYLVSGFIELTICGTFMNYVLAIKELCESDRCVHMTKVLHEVLVDYNLTDKVRIFYVCLLFCTKYLFFLILQSYARSLLIVQATIGLWKNAWKNC